MKVFFKLILSFLTGVVSYTLNIYIYMCVCMYVKARKVINFREREKGFAEDHVGLAIKPLNTPFTSI